ncbi:hypothetical protein ACFYUD_17285 [Nocardia tengchongensis]|uniref:hypothetical protein n=1 Tax=Nocardia tengchongensis TaxID=2055889 RepID=UPI003686059C
MTDMTIGAAPARTQFARPTATPAAITIEAAATGPAAVWQDAKTALVTRTLGDRKLVTAPRLVIPFGDNGLAFRVSSYAAEAEQLAVDNRVLVQPGDWRGNPSVGSRQLMGHASLVSTEAFVAKIQADIEAKYGWRMSLARAAHRLANGSAPYGNLVVLVTVFEPGPLALMPPVG